MLGSCGGVLAGITVSKRRSFQCRVFYLTFDVSVYAVFDVSFIVCLHFNHSSRK